jgi:UDP-N-acetylmuramate dehydrogenase
LEIRSQKFPDLSSVGTAGSFFKNPIISKKEALVLKKKYPELPVYPFGRGKMKISLAWILDHICNLKGFSKGDVALFQNQPLVLVNRSRASSEQIILFAKDISFLVKEKTGIEIEPEVQFVL